MDRTVVTLPGGRALYRVLLGLLVAAMAAFVAREIPSLVREIKIEMM